MFGKASQVCFMNICAHYNQMFKGFEPYFPGGYSDEAEGVEAYSEFPTAFPRRH
jgi:hypothetical protein